VTQGVTSYSLLDFRPTKVGVAFGPISGHYLMDSSFVTRKKMQKKKKKKMKRRLRVLIKYQIGEEDGKPKTRELSVEVAADMRIDRKWVLDQIPGKDIASLLEDESIDMLPVALIDWRFSVMELSVVRASDVIKNDQHFIVVSGQAFY
jgi:hypothetical protein